MIVNHADILKQNVNWYNKKTDSNRVIGWVSGGIASMVACHLSLSKFDNIELAFCDTGAESDETFEFIHDFEVLTGVKVNIYKSKIFNNPEEVWRKYLALGFANGAPCSMTLKADVRVKQVQKIDSDYAQIFGFDFRNAEIRRAKNMVKNHAELNPKFPLIENEIDRAGLVSYAKKIGIKIPTIYKNFDNNNCIGNPDSSSGGCVQGGIGYWQKIKTLYPKKFTKMAKIEHELSKEKGKPVTINKDQRGGSRKLIFLTSSPDFPELGTIDDIKGKQPVGIFECNGFCGTLDQMSLKL